MTFEPGGEHVIVEVLPDGSHNGVDVGIVAVPPAGTLPTPKRPADMTAQELRRGEDDIIGDLFRSDERSKRQVGTVVFPRLQVRQVDDDGQPLRDAAGELLYGPLTLHVRPLRQSQIDGERRKCARIWQINEDGERENVADPVEFNARVVALALVQEERERFLEDRRMWDHFQAGGPIDLLDKWLQAGELQQAGAIVLKVSNIRIDARMERLISERSGEVGGG